MEHLLGLALFLVICLSLRSSFKTMHVARDEAMRRTQASRAVMGQQLRLTATLILVVVAAVAVLMMEGG